MLFSSVEACTFMLRFILTLLPVKEIGTRLSQRVAFLLWVVVYYAFLVISCILMLNLRA